jgi:hypothetical protein
MKGSKLVVRLMAIIWAILLTYIGLSIFLDTPNQKVRDEAFIDVKLKPSVLFIQQFKAKHARLPSNREFYTWQREYYNDFHSDLSQTVDSLIPNMANTLYIRSKWSIPSDDQFDLRKANWGKDFAIGAWNGDNFEYYKSWSNSYTVNIYSWVDGLIDFLMLTIIGFLPIFFLWRKGRIAFTTPPF